MLDSDAVVLPGAVRRCLVQSLLLVRRKGLVELEPLLGLLFRLFRVPDKQLRDLLYTSIISEIRRANTPHRNNALNKKLQALLFGQLQRQAQEAGGKRARNDSSEAVASHKALQVLIELYRRGIWDDARTVNVVAEACLAQLSYKTTVTALNFFLGRCKRKSGMLLGDAESEASSEESSEEEDGMGRKLPTISKMMYKMQVAGKTRSSAAKLKKFKAAVKRQEADKKGGNKTGDGHFAAIHLLNDPYGFVERLFSMLKTSNDSFAFKLLVLNVITRVIGAHELVFLDLYSFLLRYVQPHQRNVTQLLAYAAQSSHALVPPDAIAPLLRAIANSFIAEHCRAEVIAAGLHGLYHISVRCPLAMDSTLLQDLAQYKGYQDKAVASAARSLIGLYREANPELLHRKDRGKEASMAIQRGTFAGPKAYGQVDVRTMPEGMEHLVEDQEEDEFEEAEEIELDSDSDCVEEDDDEDGEWQSVGSEDEIEISDDDEEDEDADSEEEPASAAAVAEKKVDKVQKMLDMATQKIFTPADFAMLKRKRLEAAVEASSGPVKHHPAQKKARVQDSDDEEEDEDDEEETQGPSEIVKPAALQAKTKKPKADYAARMDSIRAGREGRLEFGSKKGKEGRGSSTNAEKCKKKNQQMMAHKFEVRQKKQRSLRDKQKVIKAHAKRQKMKRK